MSQRHSFSEFEKKNELFERRLPQVASIVLFIASVAVLIVFIISFNIFSIVGAVFVASVSIVTLLMSLRGRHKLAGTILIVVCQVFVGLTAIASQHLHAIDIFSQMVFLVLAAFYISPRALIGLGSFSLIVVAATNATHYGEPTFSDDEFILAVPSAVFLVITTLLLWLFSRQARGNVRAHRERLDHNERLFKQVPQASSGLSEAASEIFAMTQQQRQGASRQGSAVAETRQTLESLLESFEHIAESAKRTLDNAEITLRNAERSAAQLEQLSRHTEQIASILATIKELANKSELLALNAALEGTKAGEAGRGFSLVAAQMQKLSESTAQAVVDIAEITENVRGSTKVTRLSTEETTKLAKTTTDAAQQIHLVVQQQRSSVEQVAAAMNDITDITNQVASGTSETLSSIEELEKLAKVLSSMVDEFRRTAR